MKLLDRYIAKSVLSAIALVTLLLAGLQVFMLFVGELNEIGKADYDLWQAACVVLLEVPYQVYLFFPMASLLGCLIGLGILANHRELVVMRAAGMSIAEVSWAVLKGALWLILLVTFIGETIVPTFSHMANEKKIQALSHGQTLRTARGVWLRHKTDFISIGEILPDNTLRVVYQYRLDKAQRLQLARRIEKVDYINGQWQAYGIAETRFFGDHIEKEQRSAMAWDVSLQPILLNASRLESDEMTLQALHHYLRHQKTSLAPGFRLAYLQRLIQPLTTVVMILLAIPFIFGPLRSSTMGSKLLAGATVGFGFHMINRFFGPIGEVFQWPPEVAAFGPTAVFALLGIYLMRRVR